jgi:hypothetical protein
MGAVLNACLPITIPPKMAGCAVGEPSGGLVQDGAGE